MPAASSLSQIFLRIVSVFWVRELRDFMLYLKTPHQTTYAKLNPVQNKADMQGRGEGAAEGPESFWSEWETAFDNEFVLRDDWTWSKCWHSPRSVVFRWDSSFLITHDDLIEKNPIKSEELPASEHTMCIENCSSKKSRDDLQLLVTTVQIQWLGKWQYIQDFFFHIVFARGSFCPFLMVSSQSSSHWLTYYFILTILIFQVNKSNFICVTGPLLEGGVHV